MTLVVDNGNVAERPVGYLVTIPGAAVPERFFGRDGEELALTLAVACGVQSDRLYTGAFVNHLQGVIVSLRDERVRLQSENESLRHDLNEQRYAMPAGSAADFAVWLTVQPNALKVGASETVYAIFDALKEYEKQKAEPEPVLAPTGSAGYTSLDAVKVDLKEVHARIDRVAEIIGNRISGLVEEINANARVAAVADRDLDQRITTLEELAQTRGQRLDDLERRQDADDHERASGDGMPEAPLRAVALEGNDDNATVSVVRQTEPTHENGLQRDAFTIGDDVRLDGAPTSGGHTTLTGWFRVVGFGSNAHAEVFTVQVRNDDVKVMSPPLYWIAPVSVLEVRHGR